MSNPDELYLELDGKIAELKRQRDEICRSISRLEAEQEREKNRLIDDFTENGVVPFTDKLEIVRVPFKVLVTDETLLPDKFFKIERKLNKKLLNDAVKGGELIQGITTSNGGFTLKRKKV